MKKNLYVFALLIYSLSVMVSCNKENDNDESPANSKATDNHEYVNLGLPSGTLWATKNVGAENETDPGLYFAWGETTGYGSDTNDGHSFNWANYKYCNGSETTMTKYCTTSKYGTVDNKTELEAVDDAATVNWGSNWQMPNDVQQKELREKCTWKWDSKNKGYNVTGPNGNSIFLPAAGHRLNNKIDEVGEHGHYWGRTLDTYEGNPDEGNSDAYNLAFYSAYVDWGASSRYWGRSVRAVKK